MEEVDDLIHEQEWSRPTVLNLFRRFVVENELTEELYEFLSDQTSVEEDDAPRFER